ncbi:hypothetical protein ABT332_11055 [Saccharomonospora azurea]|uniref:hypothetical protein n=1 Tax=Saccharomonospora azurea TaxID=40988 RepID=UPI0033256DC5
MTVRDSQPTAEQFVEMSPDEIRDHLDSGETPPELSDEQLQQLPPTTLESYIYAREAAGDTGIFGRVAALVSSNAEANSILERRQRELSAQGIEYRDGLPPSDSNYLGVDHQKLKADVEPIQAEGITVYSDNYHRIHRLFAELSEQLNSAINKSKQGWEGDAADSAHGYFQSLATWSEGNSANAEMASRIVASESEAASSAKNSMPEPIPFNMEQEMDNWSLNPFTFHDQVDQTIEKMHKSQAAHEEAAQVMTKYDFELQEAGNKQPVFAEPPKFNGASGSGDTSPSGVISINEPRTSTSGFTGGPVGSTGGVPTGGGPVNAPSAPSGSVPHLAPGVNTGVRPPNTTRPSGWAPGGRPPNMPPPGQRNNRSQFGPGGGSIGPMPMGGGGGFGPGGGGGGGRLSGGFGPGGGAGGAAGPGAGAASGAKPMGGPMGAGPGGGAAPGAAAAARGGGMGAPMGGGAGKGGQGGDDAEHQRPTYLVEADPDDVFGTSQRTAPPVIGA